MTLSLIIPVYNRLPLLEKCLAAIHKQVLAPSEIILSDDGSQEDILGFFARQKILSAVPFRLVRQEHKGFRASRVRNNGVSVSQGKILVFLDQDILVPPRYLQAVKENLKPGRFLSGYPVRLSEAQSRSLTLEAIEEFRYHDQLLPAQWAKIRSQYRKDLFSYLLCRYTGFGGHGAKLRGGLTAVLREDFEAVNGFDEDFFDCGGEDDDLGRRLLASGKLGFNFVRKPLIPLHLYHEPNYQPRRGDKNSYSALRKQEISRHDFRCAKGLNASRSDLQIF
ncbi:glycosyltransferase [Candidatus Cloacimonadaceae bacterium]|jgi:glycosyltransferase involved in cell wall biosynthesis